MKCISILFLSSLLLASTGCIPIMIHAAMSSEAQTKAAYSAYLDSMRQTNTQRELAGLTNAPVLPREVWQKTLQRTNAPALRAHP